MQSITNIWESGWAYKHASFNPNAAVTLRILARRIASGAGGFLK